MPPKHIDRGLTFLGLNFYIYKVFKLLKVVVLIEQFSSSYCN